MWTLFKDNSTESFQKFQFPQVTAGFVIPQLLLFILGRESFDERS